MENRWYQICKALSNAGARFGHEVFLILHGSGYRPSHIELLVTVLVVFQSPRNGTAGTEN